MPSGESRPFAAPQDVVAGAAAAAGGTPSTQAEDVRAFLQYRVGMFGRGAFAFGFVFLAFRVAIILAVSEPQELVNPTMWLHALGTAAAAAVWLSCRRGTRSLRFIRWIEVAGLVFLTAAFCGMGARMPFYDSPSYVVLMVLTLILVARAIYVPSTGWRTAFIGLLVGIPYLVMSGASAASVDLEKMALLSEDYTCRSQNEVVVIWVLWSAAWWLFTVLTTAAASRVVYGLRREARDARKLGQYTLEEKLGEGGMGVVYRASHRMLRRPTAIKLLPADKAGEINIARFEREVQLTAGLTHENTITVFDFGRTPEGVFYYAMELLEGATLHDVVELDGPQPASRVIHVLAQAAGALTEAHAAGLIHRDIKPSNIMLVDRGGVPDVVKVLDFGLVKNVQDEASVSLTTAGALAGTPQYLSPEGIRAPDAVDARSDLYALGAVGYYLLTGLPVFAGQSVVEVCSEHLLSPPVPPSQRTGAAVPRDLEQILLACLAKDPAERPQSAIELQERLTACEQAGAWTRALAHDWWAAHRDRLAARRSTGVSATRRTIDIDVLIRGQLT